MAGSSDTVVAPARIAAAYDALRHSKRLVVVGGGHHAFSDLCEIGTADGGILAHRRDPEPRRSPSSWRHWPPTGASPRRWHRRRRGRRSARSTIAYLRRALGFDRSRAGFRGLKEAFPGVVESSRVVGRAAHPRCRRHPPARQLGGLSVVPPTRSLESRCDPGS